MNFTSSLAVGRIVTKKNYFRIVSLSLGEGSVVKFHHKVLVVEISGYYNVRYLKDLRVNRVRLQSDISDVESLS